MSVIDEVLAANRRYSRTFRLGALPSPPARGLAVVACMDARLAIDAMLGLKPGDAHIIRNAGGLVTEDALRSLILSHYVLGTQEFMVVNHTDCGMLAVREEELRERLRRANGADSATPGSFGAFHNLEENVQGQILKIKSHPWTRHVPVRGFVYDVHSGKLKEVEAQLTRTAR